VFSSNHGVGCARNRPAGTSTSHESSTVWLSRVARRVGAVQDAKYSLLFDRQGIFAVAAVRLAYS